MAASVAGNGRQERLEQWRAGIKRGATRSTQILLGSGLIVGALLLAAGLVSYRPSDPSFNTAAAGPVRNWMGSAGAYGSDLLLSLFGPPAGLLLPLLLVLGFRLARGAEAGRWKRALALTIGGLFLIGTATGLLFGGAVNGLPASWGGAVGLSIAKLIEAAIAAVADPGIAQPIRLSAVALTALGGLFLWYLGLGLRAEERKWLFSRRERAERPAPSSRYLDDEEEEPAWSGASTKRARPARTPVINSAAPPRTIINDRIKPDKGKRPGRERQTSLALGDTYRLPTLDLLSPPPPPTPHTLDKAALERNARLLESVLDDFSVKGEIVEVRPGPVVTMYELEPASGIKASRVIQLADDIARNMSALSARVATIPGRSVIGIELPNAKREMVTLSELIASEAFEDQNAQLPLILGKNIAGDPVVADLAPMPHLLVAGTTGSGKSVGLNCMILSLLYRLTPDQCRLIMIDPKMLELSIYDDIPHLLSPVVTEPAKAIRALK